jgi:UDP-N-acetylglucosamine transferase subunit ALG13
MIFATVGTNEAPFDRFLQALTDVRIDEELVVQCGSSDVRPQNAWCVDFLPFDELTTYVRACRLVLMHAGVGSIAVALANGVRPIVVPRLRRYGEAVDDHQLHLAKRLEAIGSVQLVEDPARLVDSLDRPAAAAQVHFDHPGLIVDELRAYVTSVLEGAS